MNKEKVTLEQIAKFKIDTSMYWVALRPTIIISLNEDEQWMQSLKTHPKVIFERKHLVLGNNHQLPRLHASDFRDAINILTSKAVVEEFIISKIMRSSDTGEFFYQSKGKQEWLPESALFQNRVEAEREKKRLLSLFRQWSIHGELPTQKD